MQTNTLYNVYYEFILLFLDVFSIRVLAFARWKSEFSLVTTALPPELNTSAKGWVASSGIRWRLIARPQLWTRA